MGLILFIAFKIERKVSYESLIQPKRYEPSNIIFLGDSISAAFGWHKNNVAQADSYFRLKHCMEVDYLQDDRCTNNSPGIYGKNPDRLYPNARPNVSLAYQLKDLINFGREKMKMTPIFLENYAVSGAVPAQWSPAERAIQLEESRCASHTTEEVCGYKSSIECFWNEGRCQLTAHGKSAVGFYKAKGNTYKSSRYELVTRWGLDQVPEDDDRVFVLTLGADPILSQWMNPYFFLYGGLTPKHGRAGAEIKKLNGFCMKSVENAQACLHDQIKYYRMVEHLTDLYTYLLKRGDVLVMHYPHVCPGFFAQTNDAWTAPLWPGNAPQCNDEQKKIVGLLIKALNGALDQAIAAVKADSGKYHIASVCAGFGYRDKGNPLGDCDVAINHSHGSADPWSISMDSGVHPNKKGHQVLAQSAFYGLCEKLGHYCTELTAWGGHGAIP